MGKLMIQSSVGFLALALAGGVAFAGPNGEGKGEGARKAPPARTEQKDGQRSKGEVRPGESIGPEQRQKILAHFDKDGDGKLNDEERAAAMEDVKKRREGVGDGERMKKIVAEFDKDGDGKLNDDERAAAKEAMQKRRSEGGGGENLSPEQKQKVLEHFDKDGDGKLNDEERAAARESFGNRQKEEGGRPEITPELKAKLLEKFDKDGDGKLNDDERAAAKEAMQEHRAKGDKPTTRPVEKQ